MGKASDSQSLQLWHDEKLVGTISKALCGEGGVAETWFGSFEYRDDRPSEISREAEFITFCRAWHDRLDEGAEPDADEFDPYRDFVESRKWEIRTSDRVTGISAPVFSGDDITWRPLETNNGEQAEDTNPPPLRS